MRVKKPLFLLGAGFNCDAAGQLGLHESCWVRGSSVSADYPLVNDLVGQCFGLTELPKGKSVEDLFEEAIRNENEKPIEKLFHLLRYCDDKIPRQLIEGSRRNVYSSFFNRFPESNFVTFNYDGLVEIALLALGHWIPSDGYGVEVKADLDPCATEPPIQSSSSLVVHVHGSIYLRTNGYNFWFDPYSASGAFRPYRRAQITGDYDHLERIIAPVPLKATLPVQPYVEQAFGIAKRLAATSGPLVAIGYRFNRHDKDSYAPILQACLQASKRVVIVDPEAHKAARRVACVCPELHIDPVKLEFAEWVLSEYPGLENY